MEKEVKHRKKQKVTRYSSDVSKEEFLDAIDKCGGVLKDICRVLNISRSQYYFKWRTDPDIEEALKKNRTIGAIEITDLVYLEALSGNIDAQKIYLKFNPYVKSIGWKDESTVILHEEKPITEEEKAKLREDMFGKL